MIKVKERTYIKIGKKNQQLDNQIHVIIKILMSQLTRHAHLFISNIEYSRFYFIHIFLLKPL